MSKVELLLNDDDTVIIAKPAGWLWTPTERRRFRVVVHDRDDYEARRLETEPAQTPVETGKVLVYRDGRLSAELRAREA